MRRCAICGCQINAADNAYAFCPECREDLRMMGATDRHKLKPPPQEPPPTVEYHKRGQVPYAFGLLAYTMLCMGAGILMGWAMRGGPL